MLSRDDGVWRRSRRGYNAERTASRLRGNHSCERTRSIADETMTVRCCTGSSSRGNTRRFLGVNQVVEGMLLKPVTDLQHKDPTGTQKSIFNQLDEAVSALYEG